MDKTRKNFQISLAHIQFICSSRITVGVLFVALGLSLRVLLMSELSKVMDGGSSIFDPDVLAKGIDVFTLIGFIMIVSSTVLFFYQNT